MESADEKKKDAIIWERFLSRVYELLHVFMKISQEEPYTHDTIVAEADKAYSVALDRLKERDDDVDRVIVQYQSTQRAALINQVITRFENDYAVKMPEFISIQRDYNTPEWLDESAITTRFDKYKQFLCEQKHWSPLTVEALAKNCRRTLNHCADPGSSERTLVRGMVVSDVQAGKTSNYIGLIDLALDYGYKQILVLTTNIESLRRQTQIRIDEGVTGYDDVNRMDDDSNYFGIGRTYSADERKKLQISIVSLTNCSMDFPGKQFSNSAIECPCIMVVKKNPNVLNKVDQFFEENLSSNPRQDNILIIDDECDFASVNTKKDMNSPTAINKAIRKLLSRFRISTYVGFTATPFANIFISLDDTYTSAEETDRGKEYQDLFPADFIDLITPPKEYFGFKDIIGDEDGEDIAAVKKSKYIITLKENEKNFFPASAKKVDSYAYSRIELADSLKEAILRFLLDNVALTLEGYKDNRSMIVNITVVSDYHVRIQESVDRYLADVRKVIDQDVNPRMNEATIAKNPILTELQNLYNTDASFSDARSEYSFMDPVFIETLRNESRLIKTTLANSKNLKDRFVYPDIKRGEEAARIIQIGGYVLSRGLTLEGLVVSYFNRTSSYYDTLIQMGRWCGYRPDILKQYSKIYMTEASFLKFKDAYDATLDLYEQFREMRAEKKIPRDFGLQVRENPNRLETTQAYSSTDSDQSTHSSKLRATSATKSRHSELVYMTINLGGRIVDNSKIPYTKEEDISDNAKNRVVTEEFIYSLGQRNEENEERSIYWLDVDSERIRDFIARLAIDQDSNPKFNLDAILSYFDTNKNPWDVAIAQGRDGNTYTFAGQTFQLPRRYFAVDKEGGILRISGSHNTILDPSILRVGLKQTSRELLEEFQQIKPDKQPGYPFYLSKRQKPILVIYALDLDTRPIQDDGNSIYEQKKQLIKSSFNGPVMAYALGFNGSSIGGRGVNIQYRVNEKRKREIEEEAEAAWAELDTD